MQKLEQVHTGFLKTLLGVPVGTPNKFVYAEFARAPLKQSCWQQCMRYLERLHVMDDSRLCKTAFLAACRGQSAWRCGIDDWLKKLNIAPPQPDEEFCASQAISASLDMYAVWMMEADQDASLQQTCYSCEQQYRMEPYIW